MELRFEEDYGPVETSYRRKQVTVKARNIFFKNWILFSSTTLFHAKENPRSRESLILHSMSGSSQQGICQNVIFFYECPAYIEECMTEKRPFDGFLFFHRRFFMKEL